VPQPSPVRAKQTLVEPVEVESWRTTVMLRNLPRGLARNDLLHLLDSKGLRGKYDFVYMPFDFDTLTNLTHAFVNFCSPAHVEYAWKALDGFSGWVGDRTECRMAWNDKQQGLPSLIDRYRNSPVMHKSVPVECKPMLFHNGVNLEFPAPTAPLKMPKFRKKAAQTGKHSGSRGNQVSA
jgi:RNA recognition motif-containing protein